MRVSVILAALGLQTVLAKDSFRGSHVQLKSKAGSWDDEDVPYEDPKTAKWKDMWFEIQNTEGLRAFEELIQTANVRGDLLANSEKKLTLLIPSDEAMKAAFGKAGLKDLAKRRQSVKKLFAYHTLPGDCYLTEGMFEEKEDGSHTAYPTQLSNEGLDAQKTALKFTMDFDEKQNLALNVVNNRDDTVLAHLAPRSATGQQLYDIRTPYGCFHVIDKVLSLPEEACEKGLMDRLIDIYRRWMSGGKSLVVVDGDEKDGETKTDDNNTPEELPPVVSEDDEDEHKSPTTDFDFYDDDDKHEDDDEFGGHDNPADERADDAKPVSEDEPEKKGDAEGEKKEDAPAADDKPAHEEPAKDDNDNKGEEKPAAEDDNKPAADDKPATDDKPASDDEKKDDAPAEEPAKDDKGDDKPASDDKPADDKPADDKPADDKPADEKPSSDDKPAEEPSKDDDKDEKKDDTPANDEKKDDEKKDDDDDDFPPSPPEWM